MTIIDLPALKDFMGISRSDVTNDTLLQLAIDATEQAVKDYTGRTFAVIPEDPEDETRTFDGWQQHVLIDDLVTSTSIEQSSDNVTWVGVSSNWFEPFNTTPKTTLCSLTPFTRFVRITGVFGFGSVPAFVQEAALIWAAQLFDRKDNRNGVMFGAEFGALRISRYTDTHVAQLLDPVRRADKVLGIA